MHIPVNGFHHVRLTVTDLERTCEFYDKVFGFPVAVKMPDDPDDEVKKAFEFLFGGVCYSIGAGSLLGIRPVAPHDDRFYENRVGLDHMSFMVPEVEDLENAVQHLDELGVAHEPIKYMLSISIAILQFRDPDNNALELCAPLE